MFRSAASKLAHNSTLPSLGGNKDLRPLQDLITAEKAILQSLIRLSNDFAKASECLRSWGMGEGEDLADTLNASYILLSHFSAALGQFATHEENIRTHMKAVRTREENLDLLKRHRRSVGSKADAAEKKLAKMSPEHKSLAAQMELLKTLQDEMRKLDGDIMREEAALGDFKRQSAKEWMTLKFGGLLECAQKGTIVGEMGKLVIAEIPQDSTQPGLPRAYYQGQARTESYVNEANRNVAFVAFNGEPAANAQDALRPPFHPGHQPEFSTASSSFANGSGVPPTHEYEPSQPSPSAARDDDARFPGLRPIESEPGFGSGSFMSGINNGTGPSCPVPIVDEFGSVSGGGPGAPYSQTLPGSSFRTSSVDADGGTPIMEVQPSQPRAGARAGNRFATFPVKRPTMDVRPSDPEANAPRRPSVADTYRDSGISGPRAMSPPSPSAPVIDEAGGARPLSLHDPTLSSLPAVSLGLSLPSSGGGGGSGDTSLSSSIAQAMGGDFGAGLDRADTLSRPPAYAATDGRTYDPPPGPPPGHVGSGSGSGSAHTSPTTGSFGSATVSSPGLPPGAAPPKAMTAPPPPGSADASSYEPTPYDGGYAPSVPAPQLDLPTPSTQPTPIAEVPEPEPESREHGGESQLAYMSDPEEHSQQQQQQHQQQPPAPAPLSLGRSKSRRDERDEHGQRVSRHVKFGEVSDIDEEMEHREMGRRSREQLRVDADANDADAPLGTPAEPTPTGPPPPFQPQASPPRAAPSAPAPLAPPAAPFAAGRSVSPRPSPGTEGMRLHNREPEGRPSQESSSPTSPRSPSGTSNPPPPQQQRGPYPPPPNISLPRPSFGSNTSSSTMGGGNTPYSTPPEYPRNGSSTSLALPKTLPPPPASSANGKISAAAFRQRQQASRNASQGSLVGGAGGSPVLGGGGAGPADVAPLAFKKRPLPSSPYPQRGPSPNPNPNPTLSQLQQEEGAAQSRESLPYPRRPGAAAEEQRPMSTASSEFDYISAYMGDDGDGERRSGEGLR
ncbi:hypothetical protein PUNSTDRAFT_123417 [Punctularia strigosozonata HHB-11173 SS5]|uniref:uncharacterized protein n=1 Tax=Punctularia strigosozonata (strain HHB-11173) TaxID=741275 RepID=UPI00044165D5|nr:uncharacterized protein PUNSTDRAFT_123417 [Punctularia strigosozonata HHB-11173 SS5]EIN13334.1 hypothetical protein PUNSTDRAFT_123417 [Punctularia strigosozonata HHB-11173 SS5]